MSLLKLTVGALLSHGLWFSLCSGLVVLVVALFGCWFVCLHVGASLRTSQGLLFA